MERKVLEHIRLLKKKAGQAKPAQEAVRRLEAEMRELDSSIAQLQETRKRKERALAEKHNEVSSIEAASRELAAIRSEVA